jgi:hypothetical protein
MTKPFPESIAVDCLLDRVIRQFGTPLLSPADGEPLLPGQPIQFDHIHADVHGGPHEYQNLRPIHIGAHKKKTKPDDIAAKAKGDRILGLTCNGPKRKIASRGFDKSAATRPIPSRPMQSRRQAVGKAQDGAADMSIERAFCRNKEHTAAFRAYGLPDKLTWVDGRGAEDLEACIASFRGRPGKLLIAPDLRVFGPASRPWPPWPAGARQNPGGGHHPPPGRNRLKCSNGPGPDRPAPGSATGAPRGGAAHRRPGKGRGRPLGARPDRHRQPDPQLGGRA